MSEEPKLTLEEFQLRLLEILPNAVPPCPWVVVADNHSICLRCQQKQPLNFGPVHRFVLQMRLFEGLHQWCE